MSLRPISYRRDSGALSPPVSPSPTPQNKTVSSPAPNGVHQPAKRTTSTADLEGKWRSLCSDDKFAVKFNRQVVDLHDTLVQVVKNAMTRDKASTQENSTELDSITAFLHPNPKERVNKKGPSPIDDCVLWVLLDTAIGLEQDMDQEVKIMDMILKGSPYLAFENVNWTVLKKSCMDTEGHRSCDALKMEKSTPFHRAADNNKEKAIRCILKQGKSFCDAIERGEKAPREPLFINDPRVTKGGMLLHIAQQPVSRTDRRRALDLAAAAGLNYIALRQLMKDLPGIVKEEDPAFQDALERHDYQAVYRFLEHPAARRLFAKGKYIIQAMENLAGVEEDDATPDDADDDYVEIEGEAEDKAEEDEDKAEEDEDKAEEDEDKDEEDEDNIQLKVVKKLIRLADPSEKFNLDVIGTIIKFNQRSLWDRMSEQVPDKVRQSLLHLAVKHQNLRFVKRFLTVYSSSVTTKAALYKNNLATGVEQQEYYPLWYNKKKWENSEWVDYKGSAKIRSAIVYHTVKRIEKMQDLSDIFQQSGEPARELCFDLSHFNSKSFRVSELVQSLTHHREYAELLKYEEAIRYAEFPALDVNSADKESFQDNTYFATEHNEVFQILDWLWEKGVKSIVSLKVPDRLINPHNEKKIAEYVKKFKVEILDWRFLDLSVSVFNDKLPMPPSESKEDGELASPRDKRARVSSMKRITELHLYASGKLSAISHWQSNEGFRSLPHLKTLYINVVKETGSEKSCLAMIKFLRSQYYQGNKPDQSKKPVVLLNLRSWNSTPKLANLNEIARRIAPKLSRFIESYSSLIYEQKAMGKVLSPVKVAIIDNGILSVSPGSQDKLLGDVAIHEHQKSKGSLDRGQGAILEDVTKPNGDVNSADNTSKKDAVGDKGTSPDTDPNPDSEEFSVNRGLWSQVRAGRSFVDEDHKLSPWFFASDPHGTQMANLICAIDPFCKLYVAKVADGQYGMTQMRVSRAIRWAIEKNVDVISMSFTILDSSPDLTKSMDAARDKGIVMICSSHDEGNREVEAWPADHPVAGKLKIAACDEYGKLLRDIQKENYNYRVHGQNVAAGTIPFLASNDRITGSSVSTALVAGLSSLILSCDRLANEVDQAKQGPRFDVIKNHLTDMQSDSDRQFILLERFARIDEKIRKAEDVDARKILREKFAIAQSPLIPT